MKLTDFKNREKEIAFHCALCGVRVPLEPQWFTRLFQREVEGENGFQLFVGYLCPICGNETQTCYSTTEDATKFIEWMNVYSTTSQPNEKPNAKA